MRQLATIQKITSILPHNNADSLEVARVLGWVVVVKKGEFKVGDLCVYCEVDSILPEKPEFEFLRQSKFRIKTVRLRGQISQGICFPLSIIESFSPDRYADGLNVGDDVTEFLGITKYDPEVYLNNGGIGAARVSNFPGFFPKTDEVRVQGIPSLLTNKCGTLCYITEKLDGSSFSLFVKSGELGICSRNMRVDLSPENESNVFYQMYKKYVENNPVVLGNLDEAVIQGEVIGPKIQGNPYKLAEPELRIFSVYDLIENRYLNWSAVEAASNILGASTVPLLKEFYRLPDNVDELVELSKGKSILNNKVDREGIVIRSWAHVPSPHKKLDYLSFKVINPEFLLGH